MANLVNLENVGKSYGTTTVFESVSLGIADGEQIGVVGRNGDGKSTLLRLILGAETADTGRVTRTGGVSIASVAQRDVSLAPAVSPGSRGGDAGAGANQRDATVRAAVVGDAAEHEWAGDAAVREVLTGLGLAADLGADVTRMSGGERRRVALAAALVQQADLLVLDEPTNHLDVEGVTWLANYLRARRGALLVVTHDRWFLDAVCSRMWEVVAGGVQPFDGGYAAYVLARAERARQNEASEARRQNLLRKELAWLRRGAPARTSKPKFRIEAAEALISDVPEPRSSVELRSLAQRRLGRRVYDLEDVTVRVGSRLLLDRATWHVGPGDRVGVIGVNGSGKTHLLRLLAGVLEPTSGTVRIGQTVQSGYLSQEVTELPGGLRVLEAVREVRTTAELGGVELSASQLAERFGFGNDKQWTPVAELSGGERRRLQLLRLLLAQPNVLLLDEPTNDLDTDTLAALEDLLDSWAGTLVVVSHDRYLLERVCDTTVAILPGGPSGLAEPGTDAGGTLAALPGGVDEYLERRESDRAARNAPGARGASSARGAGSASAARSVSPGRAVLPGDSEQKERRGESRAARKELTRLERRVAQLERRERELHDALAEHATDYAQVAELDAQLRDAVAEREAAEQSWLELSDQL